MEWFSHTWSVEKPRAAMVLIHGTGEHHGRYQHVADELNRFGVEVARVGPVCGQERAYRQLFAVFGRGWGVGRDGLAKSGTEIPGIRFWAQHGRPCRGAPHRALCGAKTTRRTDSHVSMSPTEGAGSTVEGQAGCLVG